MASKKEPSSDEAKKEPHCLDHERSNRDPLPDALQKQSDVSSHEIAQEQASIDDDPGSVSPANVPDMMAVLVPDDEETVRIARELFRKKWTSKLRVATEQYYADRGGPEAPARGRAGLLNYLMQARNLIRSDLNVPIEHLAPIVDLMQALRDLDQGSVNALFETPERATRPPISTDVLRGRAQAAVAVKLMMECGYSKKAALNYVADRLSRGNVDLKGKRRATMQSSLDQWRREASEGNSRDEPTRTYRVLLAEALSDSAVEPSARKMADNLIESLVAIYGRPKRSE